MLEGGGDWSTYIGFSSVLNKICNQGHRMVPGSRCTHRSRKSGSSREALFLARVSMIVRDRHRDHERQGCCRRVSTNK